MSVFTNPASGAKEQAEAYVRAVLGLMADRDPMQVLGETPEALARVVAELRGGQLGTPEAPGKWSVAQVIHHLADSEIVWAYRLRRILAEDRPRISGYDQDLWADRLGYANQDPDQGTAVFRVLRAANLGLLGRASADELRRTGVHVERGDEALEHMVRLYAGHDLLHLRQIERIRRRVAAPAPARSGTGE